MGQLREVASELEAIAVDAAVEAQRTELVRRIRTLAEQADAAEDGLARARQALRGLTVGTRAEAEATGYTEGKDASRSR